MRVFVLATLLLLSVDTTLQLLGANRQGDGDRSAALPAPIAVSDRALEASASYSTPGRIALGVPRRSAFRMVATASTSGIPTAAWAAYQRAETVINAADPGCNLAWQLLAAIGRVESDHGRYGGNVLSTDGVSKPGIYGIALDGTHHTMEIKDTDAGQYDNDPVYDRGVGPMQFIPSTWATVGVDADGDGKRNPQDVDDAALAAAVYLCAGKGDLAGDAGRRAAISHYNHSDKYVGLVLSIMNSYLAGEFAAVPNYTTSAISFTPSRSYVAGGSREHRDRRHEASGTAGSNGQGAAAAPATPGPQLDPGPTGTTPDSSVQQTVKGVQKGVDDTIKTVDQLLSLAQATLKCTTLGLSPLLTRRAWSACIDNYTL